MSDKLRKISLTAPFLAAVFTATTLFSLLSCGVKESATRLPDTTSVKGSEPVAKSALEVEWEKTLAAARRERKVVLYTTRGADMREALYKGFTPKFGIEMEAITSAKGGDLSLKILTERRAGLHLADVQTTGATEALLNQKPAGALDNLDKMLLLPEVTDPKLWYKGSLPWVDKDHTIFSFLAGISGEIGINTNLVKSNEIKTLQDLLNPKWKGKIILNDPTVSGTGSTIVGVIAFQYGLDFLRQLAKQEPVILRDERLMIDWLAFGKYAVVIPPKPETFLAAKEAGAPIEQIYLEGISYITGDVLTLIKDAPHPNATKIFVNWLLSKEGQQIFSRVKATQSAREDITLEGVPLRQPGVNYFNSVQEDFVIKKSEYMNVSKEIFGPLMR